MNKTVKTIAWICLVLGLLGLAVDVGLYVHGRSMVARMQEYAASGELPNAGGRNIDGDLEKEDKNGDQKIGRLQPGRAGIENPTGGRRGKIAGDTRIDRRNVGPGFMGGRIGFPLFFLASGPVLTVVGAVMLIVNRDEKKPEEKNKKSKNKQS